MKLHPALLVTLCVVMSGALGNSQVQEQAIDNAAPRPDSGTASYPETPDELKQLVEETLTTLKSSDVPATDAFLTQFEIPHDAAWFAEVFGPAEGARLDAKYQELLPKLQEEIRARLQFVSRFQRIEVVPGRDPKSDPLITAALAAAKQPIKLYTASVVASRPSDPASPLRAQSESLGSFVYVSGGYRYLSASVLSALSTAPDLHLRTGGNVRAPVLTHRVQPVYPAAAKQAHVQGPVTLHVIIAKDGSIRSVSAVSGALLLVDAAVDAVLQWRYEQTRLNNVPIEVDSTVTVTFAAN